MDVELEAVIDEIRRIGEDGAVGCDARRYVYLKRPAGSRQIAELVVDLKTNLVEACGQVVGDGVEAAADGVAGERDLRPFGAGPAELGFHQFNLMWPKTVQVLAVDIVRSETE